jgi:hypothetical protein
MTSTAELGPVDPQVYDPGVRTWLPAHTVVRAYDTLMSRAERSKGRIEPFLLQLERFDAKQIEKLRDEIALSDKVARSLLTSGMLQGKPRATIDRCLKPFLKPEVTGHHGRAIFPDNAAKYGLVVKKVARSEDLYTTVWEHYWRANSLTLDRAIKLVESPFHSLVVPMHHQGKGD